MLAAAHVRCPPGKQSQVDFCWRRDDPPSQRMPPLGCAHTSIMAVTSNLSHHRLIPTSAGRLASVTGGASATISAFTRSWPGTSVRGSLSSGSGRVS